MDYQSRVAVIVLEYMEGNQQTINSLRMGGFEGPIIWARRDGVGAMSRAFNEAYEKIFESPGYDYVWFLTNVTFPVHTMEKLVATLDSDDECAAVQPAMRNSDHSHLRVQRVEKVPFVEWTAPMIRTQAIEEIGLLYPEMGYVHFDMEWCYRAMCHGWNIKVDGRCTIEHKYLHTTHNNNFWTNTRRAMRRHTLVSSAQKLAQTMDFKFVDLPHAEKTARKMCNDIFLETQSEVEL